MGLWTLWPQPSYLQEKGPTPMKEGGREEKHPTKLAGFDLHSLGAVCPGLQLENLQNQSTTRPLLLLLLWQLLLHGIVSSSPNICVILVLLGGAVVFSSPVLHASWRCYLLSPYKYMFDVWTSLSLLSGPVSEYSNLCAHSKRGALYLLVTLLFVFRIRCR